MKREIVRIDQTPVASRPYSRAAGFGQRVFTTGRLASLAAAAVWPARTEVAT